MCFRFVTTHAFDRRTDGRPGRTDRARGYTALTGVGRFLPRCLWYGVVWYGIVYNIRRFYSAIVAKVSNALCTLYYLENSQVFRPFLKEPYPVRADRGRQMKSSKPSGRAQRMLGGQQRRAGVVAPPLLCGWPETQPTDNVGDSTYATVNNVGLHRVQKKETKMFSVISPTKLGQLWWNLATVPK